MDQSDKKTLTLQVVSYQRDTLGPNGTKVFGTVGGTLGRTASNDWALPDPDRIISGKHASISYENGSFYIRDTSTNGVFVNGSEQPIGNGNAIPLSNGTRLMIGDYEMLVSIADGAAPAAPVSPPQPDSFGGGLGDAWHQGATNASLIPDGDGGKAGEPDSVDPLDLLDGIGKSGGDQDGWGGSNTGGWGDSNTGSGWGDSNTGRGWGDSKTGDGWGDSNTGDGWGDSNTGDGWGDSNTGDGWGDSNTGGSWGDSNTGGGWGDSNTGGGWGDSNTGGGWGDSNSGGGWGDSNTGGGWGDSNTGGGDLIDGPKGDRLGLVDSWGQDEFHPNSIGSEANHAPGAQDYFAPPNADFDSAPDPSPFSSPNGEDFAPRPAPLGAEPAQETQPGPPGTGSGPFGTESDPLGTGTSSFGTESDPLGMGDSFGTESGQPGTASPFGTESDPLGTETSSFGTESDPLGAAASPFGTDSDPLGTGASPFGTESDPLGTASSFGTESGQLGTGAFPFGTESNPPGTEPSLFGTDSGPVGTHPDPLETEPTTGARPDSAVMGDTGQSSDSLLGRLGSGSAPPSPADRGHVPEPFAVPGPGDASPRTPAQAPPSYGAGDAMPPGAYAQPDENSLIPNPSPNIPNPGAMEAPPAIPTPRGAPNSPPAAAPHNVGMPAQGAAPPASQAQRQPASPPAAPTGAGDSALLQAFLEGAELADVKIEPEKQVEVMRNFGQICREVIGGLMSVLMARASIKSEFRMAMTTIRPIENNPLKFSVTVEDALHHLLFNKGRGYLEPVEAVQEGFQDIKDHQMAVMAGMRAAFDSMMKRFEPDGLEERFDRMLKRAAFLTVNKKSKYWELYTELYENITQDAEDNFQSLFGEEFARAYEEQIQRMAMARQK